MDYQSRGAKPLSRSAYNTPDLGDSISVAEVSCRVHLESNSSAAHCVRHSKDFEVIVGNIILSENLGQRAKVERIVIHPDWNQPENDIAILSIPDFELNGDVQPISLPPLNNEHFGRITVYGWGRVEEGGQTSDHLLFANIPMIHLEECAKLYAEVYGDRQVIFPSNICAGFIEGGTDTCQGDSGGALTDASDPKNQTLLGITSWGRGCARPKLPGVYSRVASFIPWILDTMENY